MDKLNNRIRYIQPVYSGIDGYKTLIINPYDGGVNKVFLRGPFIFQENEPYFFNNNIPKRFKKVVYGNRY